MDLEDGKLLKTVFGEEITTLDKIKARDLVELSARRNPIGNRWVFNKKLNAKGKVEKYKAP